MTNLGGNYKEQQVVSCTVRADTVLMKNFPNIHHNPNVPNTVADLRAAFGPGYQLSGPTDAALRTIIRHGAC